MKKAPLLIIAMLLMIACGTTKLIQPAQADVERGEQKFANLTLAELNMGKAIYEQNCDNCHGLKKPESRNEEQWNKVVPKMVTKTNKKQGKEVIDVQAQQVLLKYLVTMSTSKVKKLS